MLIRTAIAVVACVALGACAPDRAGRSGGGEETGAGTRKLVHASAREPLVIGDSFTIDSGIMGEERRVNVLVPTIYGEQISAPMPVLYVLDGGVDEDFLHIAGLVQILACNGGMRPSLVVGIQNTSRRRDMTGPTSVAEDKEIAPVVGGSATFRRFIGEELMPTVRARYRTTEEAAIIGESLAGLFVVETFFLEPDLFSSYIAVDPSLWWADRELLKHADARLRAGPPAHKSIFLASSNEPELAEVTAQLAAALESHRSSLVTYHYAPLPAETHATIYHPAALLALRTVLAPPQPVAE